MVFAAMFTFFGVFALMFDSSCFYLWSDFRTESLNLSGSLESVLE